MKREPDIEVNRLAFYLRTGGKNPVEESMLVDLKEERQKSVKKKLEENNLICEMNKKMMILSKLEELSHKKLIKLENKIKEEDTKAVIYIFENDSNDAMLEKSETLRNYCQKHKINVVEEIVNIALVKTYHTKQFEKLIEDINTSKINTVVVGNLYDLGDDSLINTYIINELFTKNNVRFIAINQKIDTKLDDTLLNYENPAYVQLMEFIDKEEKRLRAESIKKSKELKKKA